MKSPQERETGWYWVVSQELGYDAPAFWNGEEWDLNKYVITFPKTIEEFFDEIGERITRNPFKYKLPDNPTFEEATLANVVFALLCENPAQALRHIEQLTFDVKERDTDVSEEDFEKAGYWKSKKLPGKPNQQSFRKGWKKAFEWLQQRKKENK